MEAIIMKVKKVNGNGTETLYNVTISAANAVTYEDVTPEPEENEEE